MRARGATRLAKLRVAELAHKGPYIAIYRLGPQLLARLEVPADERCLNPGIQGCAVQRYQPALSITRDRNRSGVSRILASEPVDGREHCLRFIADDVAPGLISHAVNPLAVGQVGHSDAGDAGPRVFAIDESGNKDQAAALGQPAGELS